MQSGEVNEDERRGKVQRGNPDRKGPSVPHHLPTGACPSPIELAAIVTAWPKLPEAVRAEILAMVKASGGATGDSRRRR
jgi:hypothetical protein